MKKVPPLLPAGFDTTFKGSSASAQDRKKQRELFGALDAHADRSDIRCIVFSTLETYRESILHEANKRADTAVAMAAPEAEPQNKFVNVAARVAALVIEPSAKIRLDWIFAGAN